MIMPMAAMIILLFGIEHELAIVELPISAAEMASSFPLIASFERPLRQIMWHLLDNKWPYYDDNVRDMMECLWRPFLFLAQGATR